MGCKHDFDLKDAFSDKSALKVPICKLCGEIGKVIIQGEKVVPKEPSTGRTIGRMSVLKAATDIEIQKASLSNVSAEVENVLKLSEELEKWVYRPQGE